jgi:hypothetical protein
MTSKVRHLVFLRWREVAQERRQCARPGCAAPAPLPYKV